MEQVSYRTSKAFERRLDERERAYRIALAAKLYAHDEYSLGYDDACDCVAEQIKED